MQYQNTQTAPLYLGLLAFAFFLVVNALWVEDNPLLAATFYCIAAAMTLLAMSFRELTIGDQGDSLSVRFGPLPIFGTRLPYAAMTSADPGRSSLIDGWGIHYLPWRGWTYNLWGFSCVVVRSGNRVTRVGSNDAERLAHFLNSKIHTAG